MQQQSPSVRGSSGTERSSLLSFPSSTSPFSAASCLSHDPFLLSDDDLPDVDAVVAHEAVRLLQRPPSGLGRLSSPSQTAAPPPVQRSLSYQLTPSLPLPSPPAATAARSLPLPSRPAEAGPVGSVSVGRSEAQEEYPSLSELLSEEEGEREDAQRGWHELEDEAVLPLSELLDDAEAEEEEAEWEAERRRRRDERQPDATATPQAVERRLQADPDESDAVDELATTQVLSDRGSLFSQSQTQAPTQQLQQPEQSPTQGQEADEFEAEAELCSERSNVAAAVLAVHGVAAASLIRASLTPVQ